MAHTHIDDAEEENSILVRFNFASKQVTIVIDEKNNGKRAVEVSSLCFDSWDYDYVWLSSQHCAIVSLCFDAWDYDYVWLSKSPPTGLANLLVSL